jgi:hypothetical protein
MIIFIVTDRFALSMNTSLHTVSRVFQVVGWHTYNSSRQRIGEPMASQRESNKQIVENDFSPPESVLVCLPASSSIAESGWTWSISRRLRCRDKNAYMYIERLFFVVNPESATEPAFTE